MSDRPYFRVSIDDLESLAERHWRSATPLRRVFDELARRRMPAARRLRNKVERRLSELTGGTRLLASGAKRTSGRAVAPRPNAKDAELTRLSEALKKAHREIRTLRANNSRVVPATAPESATVAQYAQLGLVPTCPDFVFRAAKQAWQKNLHPDTHAAESESARLASQAEFQALEETFRALEQLRAAGSARRALPG